VAATFSEAVFDIAFCLKGTIMSAELGDAAFAVAADRRMSEEATLALIQWRLARQAETANTAGACVMPQAAELLPAQNL
jgi:hypothetical protein